MAHATSAQHVITPCPTCQRRIAVAADTANGQTLTCPHCQAEFMIRHRVTTAPVGAAAGTDALDDTLREAAAPAAKVDTGDVASLPPKDGPEQEVMMLRPSLLRSNPAVYLGLWLVMAVGALLAIKALRVATGSLMWLPGTLLFAAGAVPMLAWKLRTMHSWVRITSKRIIDSDGFFRKTTSEILHRDIRNVRIEQSLLERITNTGTLSIYTSSDEVPEVHMAHVPRPNKVREAIDAYRNL
jgi:DNA-directed RNA polymerase subunit RPC12/RpoP